MRELTFYVLEDMTKDREAIKAWLCKIQTYLNKEKEAETEDYNFNFEPIQPAAYDSKKEENRYVEGDLDVLVNYLSEKLPQKDCYLVADVVISNDDSICRSPQKFLSRIFAHLDSKLLSKIFVVSSMENIELNHANLDSAFYSVIKDGIFPKEAVSDNNDECISRFADLIKRRGR